MLSILNIVLIHLISLSSADAFICTSLNKDPLYDELIKQFKNQNLNCQGLSSHLTFDDGPNEKTTNVILDELNKRNIKATFFITTTNLLPNKTNHDQKVAVLKRELKEGHTVASHGHEHNAYDLRITNTKESGYSDSEREKQINESVRLLNVSTSGGFERQQFRLFRFPYGRGAIPSQKEIEEMEKSKKMVFKAETYSEKLVEYRRMSPALHQIAEHKFSHLGWNHDSNDSSLSMNMPSEDVLKSYVKENVEALCSQKKKLKISLYHDIKEVNTRAIPLIVDLGKCLGLNFISAKEMLLAETQLRQDGTLITYKDISQSPVKTVDEIGKLMGTLNSPHIKCPGPSHEVNSKKSCYSESFKKMFQNCEGESSVCFEGKWYMAKDPFIILNCGAKGY
ncbi:MAG: polysaccharide deacetylase family protein [Bacteriovorax sp.]